MALVKTIAEVKQYIPIAYGNDVSKMPAMDAAEEKYLIDILGNDLYQDLAENYEANTLPPSGQMLLKKCQAVVVPFAYALSLPLQQTTLTNNGLQRTESELSRGAFKWEYLNALNALLDAGYSAQEHLILFLRRYSADYPLWSSSPYNDPDQTFTIIRDGAELKSVLGLQQPHRCYRLLQSTLLSVKSLYLDEVLNEEFFQALSGRIIAGTLTDNDKKLLADLRAACGRLAMHHAARELGIKFSESGFTIVNADTAKDNKDEGNEAAGAARLEAFAQQMKDTGFTYLERARNFLNATASETVFPEYYASSFYKAPDSETKLPFNNGGRKGIFIA